MDVLLGFSNGQQIRDAAGFVLVYSVDDSSSFDAVSIAKSQLEKVKGASHFIPASQLSSTSYYLDNLCYFIELEFLLLDSAPSSIRLCRN